MAILMMANLSSSFFFSSPSFCLESRRNRHCLVRAQRDCIFHKPSSTPPYLNGGDCTSDSISTVERTISTSNTQIRRWCEAGNLQSAMELLRISEKSEIDPRTLCSVLQLCADSKSLKDGEEVDSFIRAKEFTIDATLGSKLVLMYVNCGNLREGRRILDQVRIEKALFWNLLINEYTKSGNSRESIVLFKKMMSLGIKMDNYTFSSISKSFVASGGVNGGEQLHGYTLKSGYGDCNSVVNALMAFYLKNKRIESARKLFDEMAERDVISWNSIINGYITNGLAEQGLMMFEQMLLSDINVDLATIVIILLACSHCRLPSLGKAVHCLGLKSSLATRDRFSNTLLDMYSKCGDLDAAKAVFVGMRDKSVVSYTSMIAGYTREGLAGEAVKLFREMEDEGISPDVYTVTAVLHCCARNGLLEEGKMIHEWVRENDMEFDDLFLSNALMDMYAKCGSIEEARLVFSQMPLKDIVSWNTLIGGYSKNCCPNEALVMVSSMSDEHQLKPDENTMACVLPACASLAAFDKGREIHGYIMRNRYFSDRHVSNSLVDMYAKCGALKLARLLFDEIKSKDLVSWTVMIAGYGMHGLGKEAIDLFNEMRRAGIEPDAVSFIALLYACSHSGLVDQGWRFFDTMRHECGIEPTLEHYACIVDMLARSGNLSKAYRFIEKMRIPPDSTVWGALLCGCRIHHDVELAERVAEKVFELEPENTGYYVLMANIYAEADKWEEVKRVRQRIGRLGLRKKAGCSWIEIKGKANVFVSGDSSHPETEKIERLLRRVRARMMEEGYSPLMKYALIDAEEMEKEEALCGHSEKLAMALGILKTGRGKIIRVTKNLRVCGDCHEMAKFMSKLTKRQIVLRDSNRFHLFKDGHCSCRGFW